MTKMVSCHCCYGTGQWEVECCNGSGGCSCRGQPVPMGACNVCGGRGEHDGSANTLANVNSIRGYGFIGTGPAGGYFGCTAMGLPGKGSK